MRERRRRGEIISFVFLFLFSASFILPLCFMLANSFKNNTEYLIAPLRLPHLPLDIQNLRAIFGQFGILRYYANTARVLAFAVITVVILSVMASYGYAKLRFRGRATSYLIIIGTMVIPPQITIIPTYVFFARTGLLNTYVSVVVVFVVFYLPNSILLMSAYFKSIPQEIIECADLEGSSYVRKLVTIIAPIGAPIIFTTAILNSLFIWNDFFIPLILLSRQEMQTIMVALAALEGRYNQNPPLQYAGMTLGALPAIVIFVVLQRFIVKGLSLGAIK
jgi:raffinose/stachyose/melibiose transport system permease protein